MKSGFRADIGAYILLFLLCGFFFLPLFYPRIGLIATPDFGTNDALYRSFATKFEYARALKDHVLPLWTTKISTGYPIAADAIGAWLPIHLLAFFWLPPEVAYTVTLVGSVFLFGSGFFALLRVMGISQITSFFGGATLMLSGIIIPRLTHGMVLPALAIIPWLLLATHLYAERFDRLSTVMLTLIAARLFLANFPQASMLGIGFSFIYFIFLVWKKSGIRTRILTYLLLILVAMGIAGVQLIPTWEYLQASSRNGGFDPESAVQYSFHPKNFWGFLDPFSVGNPKLGTYPPYWKLYGSIFWENSGFIGPVPLILVAAAILTLLLNRWGGFFKRSAYFFLAMAAIGTILMVGKFSPLYIVFSFPPFSLFRTPSRILWITVPSLVILGSAFGESILKRFGHRRFVMLSLCLLYAINIGVLFFTWRPYHLITDAKTALRAPDIVQYVEGRTYSIGVPVLHNDEFILRGWQHPERFEFLKNGLQPNSTVFWNLSSIDVYGAVPIRRNASLTGYLSATISPDSQNIATVSSLAQRILDMSNVGTLITPYTLNAPQLTNVGSVTNGPWTIHAYRNTSVLPRARVVYDTVTVRTFEEAFRALNDTHFDPEKTALVEIPMPEFVDAQLSPTITVQESTNGTLEIDIRDNPSAGLLVVSDTYYPGWRATVDDTEESLYPVNISERGVKIPKGSHTVHMSYEPKSFTLGIIISGISSILLILITVLHGIFPSVHTLREAGQRMSRRDNNRGT